MLTPHLTSYNLTTPHNSLHNHNNAEPSTLMELTNTTILRLSSSHVLSPSMGPLQRLVWLLWGSCLSRCPSPELPPQGCACHVMPLVAWAECLTCRPAPGPDPAPHTWLGTAPCQGHPAPIWVTVQWLKKLSQCLAVLEWLVHIKTTMWHNIPRKKLCHGTSSWLGYQP